MERTMSELNEIRTKPFRSGRRYRLPDPTKDEMLVSGDTIDELKNAEARARSLEQWKTRLYVAMPYWMGLQSSDDFIQTLVLWINAHRYHGPDGIEQSWRIGTELRLDQEKRIAELEAQVAELEGRIANALL